MRFHINQYVKVNAPWSNLIYEILSFTPLNNYLSNCVITSNYTSNYITPKLIMDSVFGITYPKPFLICHDYCGLDMVTHQHFQAHKIHYLQTHSW